MFALELDSDLLQLLQFVFAIRCDVTGVANQSNDTEGIFLLSLPLFLLVGNTYFIIFFF